MPKDFQLRDVLKRSVQEPKRVSIYRDGRWIFAGLFNPVLVDQNVEYYYMTYKFGVTTLNQSNPSMTKARGKAGDYVSQDTINKNVSVVTAEEFRLLFPVKNMNPPVPTVTSAALKDKNKITNVYEESKPKVSNKGKKKLTGIKGLRKPIY